MECNPVNWSIWPRSSCVPWWHSQSLGWFSGSSCSKSHPGYCYVFKGVLNTSYFFKKSGINSQWNEVVRLEIHPFNNNMPLEIGYWVCLLMLSVVLIDSFSSEFGEDWSDTWGGSVSSSALLSFRIRLKSLKSKMQQDIWQVLFKASYHNFPG